MIKSIFRCFLVLIFFIFIIGCGNKKMPKPYIKEDMFFWKKVKFHYVDGCLFVYAKLTGNCRNLKKVYVEIDQKCINCPFRGKIFIPKYNIDKCNVSLKLCNIKKIPFRFRVWGKNVFDGLDTSTDIYEVNSPY